MSERVVVVGGGIGAGATAAALRAGGYAGELVLIDRAAFPYDRPPLSKEYLAGTRDLKQLALQQPEWYEQQRVQLITNAEVAALAPATGEVTVTLADGRTIVADRVVLATGGRAALPPIPGAGGSGSVFVIRDAADADGLRAALAAVEDRSPRLLVVGGGLIGAETAATARQLGADVVLVDPLDPPLAGAVGPLVARYLHDQHAAHGIETLATVLESVQEGPSGVAAQLRGEEQAREFDAVVIGVGMVPNTALAEAAGLEVDRGVLVDESQTTSHPRVLAIGDCARVRDQHRAEHWEAAQHDGERAAATILGASAPAATAPWWWSDRHGRHVEGVGTMRAADATHAVVVRGEIGEDPFSVFTLRVSAGSTTGVVIGAVAVDDSTAVRAARRMIDRGTVVDAGRLADPQTDLRKLLRG
jgi:NADPH-dependent 2,4-dienoyl-CoA reductase/sulfur reductase-like enzyme